MWTPNRILLQYYYFAVPASKLVYYNVKIVCYINDVTVRRDKKKQTTIESARNAWLYEADVYTWKNNINKVYEKRVQVDKTRLVRKKNPIANNIHRHIGARLPEVAEVRNKEHIYTNKAQSKLYNIEAFGGGGGVRAITVRDKDSESLFSLQNKHRARARCTSPTRW